MSRTAVEPQGVRVDGIRDTPLDELRQHPSNPRKISVERLEQLKQMLEADPAMLQARPLIALPDGTVIAGNQRLAAARELGWATIPVVVADLDDETAALWMLRDNNPMGEWEDAAVAELLAGLPSVDAALAGFDSRELDRILRAAPARDADPDDAPPLPAKPRSKAGEVYELGGHVLGCGDATDPEFVRHVFGQRGAGVKIDLVDCVWTDPPYGVSYESVGRVERAKREGITKAQAGVKEIANDGAEGLPVLLRDAFAAVSPALAHNARFYVAGPPGPRQIDFLVALRDAGWRLHEGLVWRKQRMVLGHSDYHYAHEPIFYGFVPDPNLDGAKGRPGRGAHEGTRWYGDNSQISVLDFDTPARSDEHPTMKPVALIEQCLVNSTQRGDLVYDGFAGSGSTLIACESLGRKCVALELDPGYCDVIRDRYAAFVDG